MNTVAANPSKANSQRACAPLSQRQEQLLGYIQSCVHHLGAAPTYDEMVKAMGVSRHTVFVHVLELERKGYLTRFREQARGIRVNEVCPHCGHRTEAA
jgi:SOS-response transcriptional repressor LexA